MGYLYYRGMILGHIILINGGKFVRRQRISSRKKLRKILLGYGLQSELQIPFNENFNNQIKVFSVSKSEKLSLQNKQSLNQTHLTFGGVYTINPELDHSSAIVSMKLPMKFLKEKRNKLH